MVTYQLHTESTVYHPFQGFKAELSLHIRSDETILNYYVKARKAPCLYSQMNSYSHGQS